MTSEPVRSESEFVSLAKRYLSTPYENDLFNQSHNRLSTICQTSDYSFVTATLNHLLDGKHISPEIFSSIADLLYTSCTSSNVEHQILIERQCELLTGTQLLLDKVEDYEKVKNESIPEVVVLVWSSACVLWNNALSLETVTLCSEVGSLLIPSLARIVMNLEGTTLYQASCQLLCTLVRLSPECLAQVLNCLELTDIGPDQYSSSSIRALGKICQSSSAAKQLIEKRILSGLAAAGLEIAREDQHFLIENLIAIIEFLNDMSSIEIVAKHFDDAKNNRFFRSLLLYVARNCAKSNENEDEYVSSSDQYKLLEAVIGFIQTCLSFSCNYRERISEIICDLLKTKGITNQKGASLSKSFEEIISRLIVADETILVCLSGVICVEEGNRHSFEDRLSFHPLFGCNRNDRIMKVPLNTLVSEFIPYMKKETKNDLIVIKVKQNLPELLPEIYDEFVLQVLCDSISYTNALNNNWSLEKLIRRNNHSDDSMDFEMENSRGDFNDGYFALNLRVKVSRLPLNLVDDIDVQTISPTLVYFAKCDGLKYLSCSVDLLLFIDKKLKMLEELMRSLSAVHYTQANHEVELARQAVFDSKLKKLYGNRQHTSSRVINYSYEMLYETLEKPILNMYNASQMLRFQDIVFETELARKEAEAEANKKRLVIEKPPLILPDIPDVHYFEHIIVAFSLFLEIDNYGQTLVDYDIMSAKRLVSQFLGIKSLASLDIVSDLLPVIPQSDSISQWEFVISKKEDLPSPKSIEDDILVLLHALCKCFEDFPNNEQMRVKALELGVIDVILTLLSHYAEQKAVKLPIRASGDFIVTQLVNRIFLFSNDIQGIVTMFKEAKERVQKSEDRVIFRTPTKSASAWPSGVGYGSGNLGLCKLASFGNKSGTGYGSGPTTSTRDPSNAYLFKQKQDETIIVHLLNSFSSFIKPQSIIPSTLVETVRRSCLNGVINSYMMNVSVLDISSRITSYKAVFGYLLAIFMKNSDVTNESELSDMLVNSGESSTYGWIKQSCSCIENYISKLYNEPSTSGTNMDEQEEELAKLLKTGKIVIELFDKRIEMRRGVENQDMQIEEQLEIEVDSRGYITGRPLAVAYCDTMRSLQFESVNFFNEDGSTNLFPYYYNDKATSTAQVIDGKRARRLAQESASLSNSLPLSLSSSLFVICSTERLDIMKFLLTGPADTPYSNGVFEFDVHFPKEYPNSPMSVNLMTTGNHRVRFNPNLYENGKVCLSILNTWSGRPEERWNTNSSILQVLVSIQSLILVPEPYYNEPGYQNTRGHASSEKPSRDYTANIRHETIRWAMVEQLRNPPKPFAEVIRKHFWLKRDEICLQVEEWIRETGEMIEQNPTDTQLPTYLECMKANFKLLLAEFKDMEIPAGLEHCRSKFVQEYGN